MKLLEKIEAYRLENKLSRRELCEQIDVQQRPYEDWVSGKRKPNQIHQYHLEKFAAEKKLL